MGRDRLGSLLLAVILAGPAPLRAGTREFRAVVRDLRTRCACAPMGTGCLGWIARCFSPHGVHGFRMAVFDLPPAAPDLASGALEALVREKAGSTMAPIVRVRNPRSGEHTLIYARAERRRADLLLVSTEPREIVVMSFQLDPRAFRSWMETPDRMGGRARGEGMR